jgi:hypothetical protein
LNIWTNLQKVWFSAPIIDLLGFYDLKGVELEPPVDGSSVMKILTWE